jgi:hypothetical protein
LFFFNRRVKPTPQKYGPSAPLPDSYTDRESAPRGTSLPQQLPPRINRKLPNGTIIRSFSLYGRGQLPIKNGLSLDAAAKLIDKQNNLCKAYFYISSESPFTLTGVPDGNYQLLFGIGEDWDSSTLFFTRSQVFSEFDKPMFLTTFEEKRELSVYEKYTTIEVTLHPVPGGNIRTYSISGKEFQQY